MKRRGRPPLCERKGIMALATTSVKQHSTRNAPVVHGFYLAVVFISDAQLSETLMLSAVSSPSQEILRERTHWCIFKRAQCKHSKANQRARCDKGRSVKFVVKLFKPDPRPRRARFGARVCESIPNRPWGG